MKIYNSIEEWSKDWTPEKEKLYNEIGFRNWGSIFFDKRYFINDRELSEIIGAVRFTIPIKQNDTPIPDIFYPLN